MPQHIRLTLCITAAAAFGLAAARHAPAPSAVAQPNDNRQPAGVLTDNALTIALEIRAARWFPESDSGPSVEIAAFAEAGRAPQVPGPLIRVPSGTVIRATLRNALSDSAVTIHGFVTRPAPDGRPILMAPGESREVVFQAGAPGTYFYWASVGNYQRETNRLRRVREREQLAGAFVVDEPGSRPDDRVFVMNVWGEPADSEAYRSTLTINGRSWPHTERISATTGDSLRWRVINTSVRGHPMHLHGFYYQITALGDALSSRPVRGGERPLEVTHEMRAFEAMDVVWSPDRSGNWLFHCHVAFHVIPEARLDPVPASHNHSADARRHMAGLILGINVRDRSAASPAATSAQQLRVLVQEGPRRSRAPRSVGFVLQRGPAPPGPDSVEIPGSVLILTRGTATSITVVNRLAEPTAVHWHGIELESYWDGVAGWSGDHQRVAPSIAARDSFTAQLTLPRAGTFMYHTHLNDVEQLTSGLYGAIVVLEPGQRWDPITDHVVVVGWDGNFDQPTIVFNGDSAPPPLVLAAGRTHRLRLVNIGPAGIVNVTLRQDTTLAVWRRLAKDGANLPAALQTESAARIAMTVGETYDVAFTPPGPGTYELRGVLLANRVSRQVIVR